MSEKPAPQRRTTALSQIVAEELHVLLKECDNRAEPQRIRRASVGLRKLIVEGGLQRAWKDAGFPKSPLISCYSLAKSVGRPELKHLLWMIAGGASHLGATHAAGQVWTAPPIQGLSVSLEHLNPVQFGNDVCMLVGSRPITRHTLIKFFANAAGGAHLPKPKEANRPEYAPIKRFAEIQPRVYVGRLDALTHELLSTAQAIIRSSDVQSLAVALIGESILPLPMPLDPI